MTKHYTYQGPMIPPVEALQPQRRRVLTVDYRLGALSKGLAIGLALGSIAMMLILGVG